MLDHEEKIIKAQNSTVNVQYSVLIVLGFIIFDLMTKMGSIADLFPVRLRQFPRWIAPKDQRQRIIPFSLKEPAQYFTEKNVFRGYFALS